LDLLVIWFLISSIRSLDFAYASNRLFYHFTVKVNGLPSVTCVLFKT
jgi:hypothetical protein